MAGRVISFAATGDVLAVKRLCRESPDMRQIRELLCAADIRLMNLETTVHAYELDVFPAQQSGGDWVACTPDVLADLEWIGFNAACAANNHSLDWLHTGLLRTVENLERSGIVYAGIGRNLFEASRPRYLETPSGRVALIAVNSSMQTWHPAGEQRRDCIGRPGINPLRFEWVHRIPEERLAALQRIAGETELAARTRQDREGFYRFGNQLFEIGKTGSQTYCERYDLERIGRSIGEAARQADVVVVSCHSHQRKGDDLHMPADFQREFAHFCIDAGAHVYHGHGPHVLRGVELYRDRLILHGLGDFFYQCELLDRAPQEYYDRFGRLESGACPADGYDYRIARGGVLGELNPAYYRSVIAGFSLENGSLRSVELTPVSLQFDAQRAQKGTPQIACGKVAEVILAEVQTLSAPFGVQIRRAGDTAHLMLT